MERRVSQTLAERLKSETGELHRAAERSCFMSALLRGRLDRRAYALLLRSLHEVYASLEAGLDAHATHPQLAPLWCPGLARRTALEGDLDRLAGRSWAVGLEARPAARRHAMRLQQLAREAPGLLAAHAYVRYLGDLSGGQMLAPIVERSLQLQPGEATRFYDFGGATATAQRARELRDGLAAIDDQGPLADAQVAEAKLAFGLHLDLFGELASVAGLSDQASEASPRSRS